MKNIIDILFSLGFTSAVTPVVILWVAPQEAIAEVKRLVRAIRKGVRQ